MSHIVALEQDIHPHSLQRARLGDLDLVIWHGASGDIHVWEDRCPHRSVRLSAGRNMGSYLQGIYHGWRFGEAGDVIAVPAEGGQAFLDIRVNVLASVVSGGFVWAALEGVVEPATLSGTPMRPLHFMTPAEVVQARMPDGCHVTPWGAAACMVFGVTNDVEGAHRRLSALRQELEAAA